MQNKILYITTAIVLALIINYQSFHKDNDTEFESFKLYFKKNYHRAGEEQYRKLIFLKNKAKIDAHNADPTQTYQQGINQFADMTLPELNAIYADLRIPTQHKVEKVQEQLSRLGVQIDWVAAGKVGPVIDQGQCGASWAWSAIGAFQSRHMIKGNNFFGSAQELLDCTESYGNYGCNGGFMSNSFQYIKQHRIHEAQDYPYTAKNQKCKKPSGTTWTLSSYTQSKKCDDLLNALSSGPVSVAVDMASIYNYKSGIITKCGTTPNSGSLVVGVTDDYWRLKQSFSVNWGENGFFRLARGNTCAVCDVVSYPTI